jgi:hypothetical protein
MRFRICNPKANGCGFVIRLHKMKKMRITDPQQVSSGLQIPNSKVYHMLFRICNPKANGCGFVIRIAKQIKYGKNELKKSDSVRRNLLSNHDHCRLGGRFHSTRIQAFNG